MTVVRSQVTMKLYQRVIKLRGEGLNSLQVAEMTKIPLEHVNKMFCGNILVK